MASRLSAKSEESWVRSKDACYFIHSGEHTVLGSVQFWWAEPQGSLEMTIPWSLSVQQVPLWEKQSEPGGKHIFSNVHSASPSLASRRDPSFVHCTKVFQKKSTKKGAPASSQNTEILKVLESCFLLMQFLIISFEITFARYPIQWFIHYHLHLNRSFEHF